MHVAELQVELTRQGLDGWLVVSFRGSNPLFADLTGIQHPLTRRVACWLPRDGTPIIFGSAVDGHGLQHAPFAVELYGGLADFQDRLQRVLQGCRRVALEYTPDGANPVISRVDAGFVDWVRAQGVEVVSSGDLIAALVRWDASQVADHRAAAAVVDRVRAAAYAHAFDRAAANQPVTEQELADFILAQFAAAGLVDGAADVAVNANAADPHYASSPDRPVPIRPGDVLLVDLWARRPSERAPFADSTWVGFVGSKPPVALVQAFDAVRAGRDAGLRLLEEAWSAQRPLRGRDVDRHVRGLLVARGRGAQLRHRTGHSLGWHHVHGDGPNLDDVEFPDDRLLSPVAGITIEPGVYLDGQFGIRLEVSVLLTEHGPEPTTALQERLEVP